MSLQVISTERRVENDDVDGYSVMHFARYALLLESVALEALEQWGCGLSELECLGLELRVRELRIRYLFPARHGDKLRLNAELVRRGLAHLRIKVSISRMLIDRPFVGVAEAEIDFVFIDLLTGRPRGTPSLLPDVRL
jgi:acyl-CoA thioesterase FadM